MKKVLLMFLIVLLILVGTVSIAYSQHQIIIKGGIGGLGISSEGFLFNLELAGSYHYLSFGCMGIGVDIAYQRSWALDSNLLNFHLSYMFNFPVEGFVLRMYPTLGLDTAFGYTNANDETMSLVGFGLQYAFEVGIKLFKIISIGLDFGLRFSMLFGDASPVWSVQIPIKVYASIRF
jgi:hypothetical protein